MYHRPTKLFQIWYTDLILLFTFFDIYDKLKEVNIKEHGYEAII